MYSVIHLLNKWGQVYFREGISPVDVYERLGKSVILACKKAHRG